MIRGGIALLQQIEQRRGALEIGRIEAFGEPFINWREKVAGFNVLALVTPEAGKARRSSEFEHFGILAACNRSRAI